MNAKSQWRVSSTGPDWTDVLMMARAMETLHECRIRLAVTPAMLGHNGSGVVEISAAWDRLKESRMPSNVVVQSTWPTARNLPIEGVVYKLLWELDYRISEIYEQQKIPL